MSLLIGCKAILVGLTWFSLQFDICILNVFTVKICVGLGTALRLSRTISARYFWVMFTSSTLLGCVGSTMTSSIDVPWFIVLILPVRRVLCSLVADSCTIELIFMLSLSVFGRSIWSLRASSFNIGDYPTSRGIVAGVCTTDIVFEVACCESDCTEHCYAYICYVKRRNCGFCWRNFCVSST